MKIGKRTHMLRVAEIAVVVLVSSGCSVGRADRGYADTPAYRMSNPATAVSAMDDRTPLLTFVRAQQHFEAYRKYRSALAVPAAGAVMDADLGRRHPASAVEPVDAEHGSFVCFRRRDFK